ncbi:hypothetical protein B0H67DRAFT_145086 [Lasiosphaeris hirsuta]|uniref:NIPSNAP domain-containing protein n=1 Tax=Lasiosphaeris hirsuta TaxID=260670 RepID=A0AA40B1L5_9PEZI|nr:hypothetical protein B0H67DRAFT_145086 [Lasiosphaeris hirsuta]
MLSQRVARAATGMAARHQQARAFSSSLVAQSKHTPSLGDIEPDTVERFNSRQKKFREQLAEAQKQRDARNAAKAAEREQDRKAGPLTNLIYGTKEGREMDAQIEASFSQVLARGKYVHSIVFHDVKPECVDEYVDLVGKWYPAMASIPENKVHLVGSWRTEVGDCDTFVHIWEYQRYQGYHASLHSIRHHPEYPKFEAKLQTLIKGKNSSLMQEFSFWPTTPPRQLGGLFELRSYTLHPGNLLEWETHWRRGLKARREVMEGVGAWFVQIGDLNTVHHLWQFADLEERKVRREKSWGIEGWADTVHKTVPLIEKMKSRILIPMPWSPVA